MAIEHFLKWRPSAIYRSNRYGDIAIFVIFQDGGRRYFWFAKVQHFIDRSAVRGQYASLYQILSKSVKRLQRYSDLKVFFKMAAVRHLGFVGRRFGTTHDELLMVSIVVQNLVEIDAVVLITWNFQYFARLAWKRLFTPQKLGFLGYFTPKMRSNVNKTPKRHILAQVRVVWAIKRENPSMGLTCRWVHATTTTTTTTV